MTTGNPERPFTTTERATDGAIVTLINLDTGEERVELTQGHYFETKRWGVRTVDGYGIDEQLHDLLDRMQTWEGNWRVRTICTPQSIYADIRGRQESTPGVPTNMFEQNLLGRLDRLHLWERFETVDTRRSAQRRNSRRRIRKGARQSA